MKSSINITNQENLEKQQRKLGQRWTKETSIKKQSSGISHTFVSLKSYEQAWVFPEHFAN